MPALKVEEKFALDKKINIANYHLLFFFLTQATQAGQKVNTICDELGCTRQYASRMLNQLTDWGYLKKELVENTARTYQYSLEAEYKSMADHIPFQKLYAAMYHDEELSAKNYRALLYFIAHPDTELSSNDFIAFFGWTRQFTNKTINNLIRLGYIKKVGQMVSSRVILYKIRDEFLPK